MYNGFLIPIFQGDIGEMTKKKLTKYENSRTFWIVFTQLCNMALSYRYKLNNLPDTMDARVAKQSLLFYANVVLFDLDGVSLSLPGGPDGSAIDLYGNSQNAIVFSRNGRINFSVPLNYKYTGTPVTDKKNLMGMGKENNEVSNGVIVWENDMRQPFIWTVIYYAERIADTLRTLDMDRRWLKRPFIPRCEESEGNKFDESLKQFMNNEDFNTSVKARNIDKTDIFSVDMPPELVTKVTQLYEWYMSQFKIACGIKSNSQVDKKGENLVSDEINIDDGFTNLNVTTITDIMQEQIDVYNKLSGNNINAEAIVEEEKEYDNEDATGDTGRGDSDISESGGRSDE